MTVPGPSREQETQLRRRLIATARPYRHLLIWAAVLLLLQSLLALVMPAVTQRAIDQAIPAGDQALLLRLGLLGGAALVVSALVEYAQAVATARVGQQVMSDLRRRIFDHFQRLGIPFFDGQPVGRLVTRATSDVETLNELLSSGLVAVLGDLVTVVTVGVMMLLIDWRLALVTFLVLPVLAIIVVLFRGAVRSSFAAIRTVVARMNSYLSEHLSGVRVVQFFHREAAVREEFARINRDHRDAQYRSIFLYALFFPVVEVLMSAALALVLWFGGGVRVQEALSIGVLAAFIQLVRRFFQPLQDLAEKFNLLQSAMASGERIFGLLDTPVPPPRAEAIAPPPTALRGELVFEDVWFRYQEEGPWVLRGISFTVGAGETVALVGHTGAGKSTILSLLLDFHTPTKGRILLDGHDLATLDPRWVRARIGYVPQDLFLFRGDLLRNLRLDRPLDPAAVAEAAAIVGAGDLIARLPGGLAHQVAERGRSLSMGERQLLSLARAVAGDPAILLLDEATSAVDPATEARIQAGLDQARAGRTALVVAHRLGTIRHADRIHVLHHGDLRESGTHDELLARGGLYHQLVTLQYGGRERRIA